MPTFPRAQVPVSVRVAQHVLHHGGVGIQRREGGCRGRVGGGGRGLGGGGEEGEGDAIVTVRAITRPTRSLGTKAQHVRYETGTTRLMNGGWKRGDRGMVQSRIWPAMYLWRLYVCCPCCLCCLCFLCCLCCQLVTMLVEQLLLCRGIFKELRVWTPQHSTGGGTCEWHFQTTHFWTFQ